MKKIVIHLGLHRTGTTFLQKEVFEKMLDVNYIFDDSLHRFEILNDINLISNEGLSLSMPHSYTHRLQVLKHIKKLFPDAKIIIGFREKKSWLKSCYYRYILSGGTSTYDDYLEVYAENIIDYDKYLFEVKKNFSEVFVYQFEDLKKNPDKVISDMCNFIGCKVPNYKIVKRNASLNEKQLNTLRLFNKLPSKLSLLIIPFIKFIQRTPT